MTTVIQQSDLVRKSSYAGRLYPADPIELEQKIKAHLGSSRPVKSDLTVKAAIIPWSTALCDADFPATQFADLRGQLFETIVILAPSQNTFFNHVSIFSGGAYDTPLGKIFVNLSLAEQLAGVHPQVVFSDQGHTGGKAPEMIIESALPILQVVLGTFAIVPIVLGSQESSAAIALGEALSSKIRKDDRVLIIAMSDLDFPTADSEKGLRLQQSVKESIAKLDYRTLEAKLATAEISGNGQGAIISCLYAAKRIGANQTIDVFADENQNKLGALFF